MNTKLLVLTIYERLFGRWRTARAATRILRKELGHDLSVRRKEPLDRDGRPLPWFTYPAIEYLAQLNLSDCKVFEFGAGNSTLYWCARAKSVLSVEHNPQWHHRVSSGLPANGRVILAEDLADYPAVLTASLETYDLIIVDGVARRGCCEAAVARLNPGGLIILDNSDWHHHCAALLRNAGLLEVDMTGFGPINGYTWTTSFFFHRAFSPRIHGYRQPRHGIGSLSHEEEL